ncbi:male-specific lethal 3 homolog isoform X2 [Hydractinia symbiolongicarpus]|uniref:male-specific lethal 3 homolog isoform X2 n=1 Tax=Hydractinia symbiolongicarpus TaxID=13093 RepID=UPI00254F3A45|nr:male-specific lethal 3 homolog isoform X2 [Hydractinia symbiolongicarpus]
MSENRKPQDKCKFQVNELVLCYEPDPMKACMLYEAKILDIDITKDDKGRKVSEYYVHFQGWNKSWDRWILEEQLLKDIESGRALQAKLYKEAIKPKKKLKKTPRNGVFEEKDDTSVISIGSINSAGNEEDISIVQLPLVSLDIPKVLANRLEEDCYNIKRRKKMIHLPRKPTVNDIFNEYFQDCKLQVKEGKNININVLQETLSGLNTYFNFFLCKLLLYNFERDQYFVFFPPEKPAQISPTGSMSLSIFSPTITPQILKTVSPLSCFDYKDSSPKASHASFVSEDLLSISRESWKRRQTNKIRKRDHSSSSCNDDTTNIPTRPRRYTNSTNRSEERFSPVITNVEKSDKTKDVSTMPHRKSSRGSLTTAEEIKEEALCQGVLLQQAPPNSCDSLQISPDATKHNEAKECSFPRLRRLRRSRRSCSIVAFDTSVENDFMAIGSSAKSLEKTAKGLPRPLRIDIPKMTGSTDNKNFVIFPQRSDGDTPADIYGIEHLLRLFVKIPVLLASCNVEECEVNVILQNISSFLEETITEWSEYT